MQRRAPENIQGDTPQSGHFSRQAPFTFLIPCIRPPYLLIQGYVAELFQNILSLIPWKIYSCLRIIQEHFKQRT